MKDVSVIGTSEESLSLFVINVRCPVLGRVDPRLTMTHKTDKNFNRSPPLPTGIGPSNTKLRMWTPSEVICEV